MSTPSPLHPFDEAIALEPLAEGRWRGTTHPGWANMVGPYGGITAATLLHAAAADPRGLGEPLALTVNYAGPQADGAFEIEAQPARTNRSTQHWTMALRQGGEVVGTATAVFAVRRETWAATDLAPPSVPPAAEVPAAQTPFRVVWPQRYEMRFVEGGWPDFANPAEVADSHTALWIRDEPPRPLDALSLAAICDVFYPRIFRRRQRPTPAGTVSITTFFHADARALATIGTRHLLGRARAHRYTQGFFDQTAEVWSDDAHLLASSHQVVYFKE
jgi:acyl-CoA thioesterase